MVDARGSLMERATKTEGEVLQHNAIEVQRRDDHYRELFYRLTRKFTQKRKPGGTRAWIFYQVAAGQCKPLGHAPEAIQIAMEAGAPEEDVRPLALALLAQIDGFYARKELLPPVEEALRLEAHAGAAADAAQADAMVDPSPSNIARVIDLTSTHERTESLLLQVCQRLRFARPRPMQVTK